MALPRTQRISSAKEIQRIIRTRPSGSDDFFTLRIARDDAGTRPRFGVLVSSKVAKSAVQRNAIRRKVTEALRKHTHSIRPGISCLITVKTPDVPTGPALEQHLYNLIEKSGIVY